MTARQALWVLWPEGPNTRGRIEVGGILFCGYWGPHRDPGHLGLRQFCSLWPHETVECAWVSLPEDYSSRAVAVKILAYPSTEREWQTHVEASLHWFVAMGALISWCGHEMVSASIEAVGPDGGDGLVYAGYAKQTGMVCHGGLDDELKFLDDDECALLWRSSQIGA